MPRPIDIKIMTIIVIVTYVMELFSRWSLKLVSSVCLFSNFSIRFCMFVSLWIIFDFSIVTGS